MATQFVDAGDRSIRQPATLTRETFQTSRILEYFSEKELTLQTGHEPDRWPEVIVKELIDNALDACEEAGTLPDITVTINTNSISVQDNGPGLPRTVVEGILDFTVRTSSKDAYISPTRGAQGNALKTVVAIPYVLSGCETGEIAILSGGEQHQVQVTVDRIAQQPVIRHVVSADGFVKTGTLVTVTWPDSAGLLVDDLESRFLQLIDSYSLFNPHATFVLALGATHHVYARTVQACAKWIASQPTSPHWYTPEQLRNLVAAYVHAERLGGSARTVREFVSEFRGLSGTAKQKTIVTRAGVHGVHLRDLVHQGDIDRKTIERLLAAMCAESQPVKPARLGILGQTHLSAWLTQRSTNATTITYAKTADVDDDSGRPFVVETAFGVRNDCGGLRLVTGINWAPTLVDPFRALNEYGLSLDGLLGRLHLHEDHPITFIVHLACPHLNFSDRGKSSLEGL